MSTPKFDDSEIHNYTLKSIPFLELPPQLTARLERAQSINSLDNPYVDDDAQSISTTSTQSAWNEIDKSLLVQLSSTNTRKNGTISWKSIVSDAAFLNRSTEQLRSCFKRVSKKEYKMTHKTYFCGLCRKPKLKGHVC